MNENGYLVEVDKMGNPVENSIEYQRKYLFSEIRKTKICLWILYGVVAYDFLAGLYFVGVLFVVPSIFTVIWFWTFVGWLLLMNYVIKEKKSDLKRFKDGLSALEEGNELVHKEVE